ncbi:MAG: sulfotransferase [Paracoccaceae bacterium]
MKKSVSMNFAKPTCKPMADHQDDVIVVLGMHRSGTSATTRALRVLGVELGSEFSPPPDRHNAKGYWEDRDILSLNVEMLKAIDRSWNTLQSVEPKDFERLSELGFEQRALDLLQRKTAGARPYGFKDPRIIPLLPFWDRVIARSGLKARYVLMVRNPLNVGASLAARDAMDGVYANYLWLLHNVSALGQARRGIAAVVSYDELMQNPGTAIDRLSAQLGLPVDPEEKRTYLDTFLEPELDHSAHRDEDVFGHGDVPRSAAQLYRDLMAVARGNLSLEDPQFIARIELLEQEIRDLQPLFARMRQTNPADHRLSVRQAASALTQALHRAWRRRIASLTSKQDGRS